MAKEPLSLKIGSLQFTAESLSYIVFGFFLLGVLMGLLSIIHIDNPEVSLSVTMPLLWTAVIPMVIIGKGVRKATVVK
ncbi:MAG TPA: hypothetical protein VF181_03150 [Balneolaceae bacterium]